MKKNWIKNTSVVIPLTRKNYLNKILESLGELNFKEILVITNIKNINVKIPNVKFIFLKDLGNVSKTRNYGAKNVSGKYIFFIDDDVLIENKTINYLHSFPFKHFDIICGKYNDDKIGDNFFSKFQNITLNYRALNSDKDNQIYSSSHFLIKKEIFDESCGFNESLKGYEDIEFFYRCKKLGYKINFDPKFQATHLKSFSLFTLLSDYLKKSSNALHARCLYPKILKNRINLPLNLKISYMSTGLFLLISPLLFTYNFLFPAAFIFFILQFFLTKNIYYKNNSLDFIKSIFTVILVGGSVILGTTFSLFKWFFSEVKYTCISLFDLLVGLKRVLVRNGMPVQIINYVTSRCNLRCAHCFYKDTLNDPDPGEMKLDLLNKTTKEIGPVLWYSLAGGEPFIRKDLVELVGLIKKNCRPKVFSFPTNGWYSEKTYKDTMKILQSDPKGNFILFFSLDGPKKIHDKIRGKGSYDRVKKTFDNLKKLQKLYKNLYLNFIITVTPDNSEQCPGFIKTLVKNFNPSAISINLFRYHSLKHPPLPNKLIKNYKKTVDTYKKYIFNGLLTHYSFFGSKVLMLKEILQKELIYNVAKFDKFVTPCTAGNLSYVIMEDGSLKSCEILPDNLGKISNNKNSSIKDLFFSKKAKELRSWIYKTKCKCTYECAMSTNTLFTVPMVKKWVKKFPSTIFK